MSTPATIIVKVREKDVGKIRKCDIDKINLRTIEMARDLYRTFVKNENEIDEILTTSDKVPNKEALAATIKGIKLARARTISSFGGVIYRINRVKRIAIILFNRISYISYCIV